jgi:superkiller protein 3
MSSYSSQGQIIVELARNPLDLRAWQDLTMIFIGQRDQQTITTLQLITKSLGQLAETVDAGSVRLLPSQTALLASLASRPNDPQILKKVGLMFQHEFNLPAISSRYFLRALEINPGDPELAQLSSQSLHSPTAGTQLDRIFSSKNLPTIVSKPAAPLDARTAISRSVKIDPSILEKIQARKSEKQASTSTLIRRTHQGAIAPIEPVVASPQKLSGLESALKNLDKETLPKQTPLQFGLNPAPSTPVKRPATSNMQAQIHHAAAQRALSEGKTESALHELHKAQIITKRIPQVWNTWNELALAFHTKGELARALECYKNAVATKPDFIEAWFNLAACYQEDGQSQAAFEAYDEVVQLDPQHARGWCNMGVLCFEVGDYEQAVFCCEQAALSKPDYAKAWDNLGVALSVLGRLDQALPAFEKAVKFNPENAEGWFRLGSLYADREENDKAAHAFEECVQRLPEHWEAWIYLSLCKIKQGKLDEAYQILDRVAENSADLDHLHTALNELGLAVRRAGDPVKAIEIFLRVIEINPGLPEAWFNLGVAMDKSGQSQGALKSFRQAVKLQPDFTMAWNNLGTLYLEQNLAEEAAEVFETVTKLEPAYSKGWFNLGFALEKLGRAGEADRCFAKSQELDAISS